MNQVGNPALTRLRKQIADWEQRLNDAVENSDSPDVIALKAKVDAAKAEAEAATSTALTAQQMSADASDAARDLEPRMAQMEANGADYATFKTQTTGALTDINGMIETIELTPGQSAFELAQDHGYTGTEAQWLATLIGQAGTTPTLTVGTVTTKAPGATAEATVTGTPTAPKLNLGIPQGAPGMTIQAIGVGTIPVLALNATVDITVTLNQTMPNTTYGVAITPLSGTLVGQVQLTVKTKTTTTVTVTAKALMAVGAGNVLVTAWG